MSAVKLKGYLKALIIGGLMGVAGNLVMKLYLYLGASDFIALLLTIYTFGLIGSILTAFGPYGKLCDFAGVGAMLPMSGLAAGVVGGILGHHAAGETRGKAAFHGTIGPLCVFFVGAAVGLIAAVIVVFVA